MSSSDEFAKMSRVTEHSALRRLMISRASQGIERDPGRTVVLSAEGLADPEVATATIGLLSHLADRLQIVEEISARTVDVLSTLAADSTSSRSALLETLAGISERLAEAPQVNVTVPVPEVNVTVEQPEPPGERDVTFERDAEGKLVGATVDGAAKREITLERDGSGKLVGATVEVK